VAPLITHPHRGCQPEHPPRPATAAAAVALQHQANQQPCRALAKHQQEPERAKATRLAARPGSAAAARLLRQCRKAAAAAAPLDTAAGRPATAAAPAAPPRTAEWTAQAERRAFELARALLSTACARDGVEERLQQIRRWNSEGGESADLDLLSHYPSSRASSAGTAAGATTASTTDDRVQPTGGGAGGSVGSGGGCTAATVGGCSSGSRGENGTSKRGPRHHAQGQAAPMVLNLECPSLSSDEVIEIELGRLGMEQLRRLRDALDCGAAAAES
jgi:hypothetical protein